MTAKTIIKVVLPRPLHTALSYSYSRSLEEGVRVQVPFKRSMLVGVVVNDVTPTDSHIALKPIAAVLDDTPVLNPKDMQFLRYIARYYQHPLGEVVHAALPNALLKGAESVYQPTKQWHITPMGMQVSTQSALGKKQRYVLSCLARSPKMTQELNDSEIKVTNTWLTQLAKRGWIKEKAVRPRISQRQPISNKRHSLTLNDAQKQVLSALQMQQGFAVSVLDGVTGSGKTAVYIQFIDTITQAGGQVLLLAPEIGLVETLVAQLSEQLTCPLAAYHSGMTNNAQLRAWQAVSAGDVGVLVGTRSAVFARFADLRAIIVDEAHDYSYKQQDGLRYHARDMAIVRARLENVPIVLGSATHDLSVWKHVWAKDWQHLRLSKRVRAQENPKVTLHDVRNEKLLGGLSQALINVIRQEIAEQRQVLLFLNRRGYAPLLLCRHCGETYCCPACDWPLTVHIQTRNLQCHHCGRRQQLPTHCVNCQRSALQLIGLGIQRLEKSVREQFPQARILRIDTDAFSTAKQFSHAISQIKQYAVDIVIGTQWLSKGHHFPKLNLVCIVDADQALYSADFRAEERLAQLLVQVGGRAGREGQGHIWVQTRQPTHAVFNVFSEQYEQTAQRLAQVRQRALLPPFSAQALLFARHGNVDRAQRALTLTKQGAQDAGIGKKWLWLGPAPALMPRKDGQFRVQMLVQAPDKLTLQGELPALVAWLYAQGKALSVPVGIDVDPLWME